MSFKKIELMFIGKSTSHNPIVPLENEGNIKVVVEHFKYLEAFSSADGTSIKELNRIGKAAGAFRELDKWKDLPLNLDIKMKFYNSYVLYAAECWNLTERDEARLDAFDMRCQRKIMGIAWSQRMTNKYVRFLTKQLVLSNTIRKRRLQ